jgi:hypothetical protein
MMMMMMMMMIVMMIMMMMRGMRMRVNRLLTDDVDDE